jgi:hypothetical protein
VSVDLLILSHGTKVCNVLFDAWFIFSRFEGLGTMFACHHSFVCLLCVVVMRLAY